MGDDGEWWLPMKLVQPYTPALDAMYPVATIVPSVVLRAPLDGDRGDVAAVGTWSRGRWRLEVKRKLDTGSPFDVAIADGIYLWVAVFRPHADAPQMASASRAHRVALKRVVRTVSKVARWAATSQWSHAVASSAGGPGSPLGTLDAC